RIFEESLRVDSSVYIFGLRLNMYIASVLAVIGAIWFYRSQRRPLPVDPVAAEVGVGAGASAGPAGDDAPADDPDPGSPPDGSSAEGSSATSGQATSEP
ncbi:MAG: hypothetical protein ACRDOU_29095, partial [Streptosporangiaceae bacterium]